MRALVKRTALLALASLAAAGTARGEAITLRHVETVYADAKKTGLKAPEGVACTDKGRVVVADSGNGRLVVYSVKPNGVGPGTPIKFEQLGYPVRVEIDRKGNVLALDRKKRKIVRVGENGGFAGYLEPKGAAAFAPAAFKLDPSDRAVVLDLASSSVLVLDEGGAVVRKLPLPQEGTLFTDVAIAPNGALYALDAKGGRVWAAEKDAKAFTAIGKSLKDSISFPAYLTTTSRGTLLIADQNGNGIAVVGQDGTFQGRQLAVGWTDGLVMYPSQLCITPDGDFFVADRNNHRVQYFTVAR